MKTINYAFAIIVWSLISASTAVLASKHPSPFVPVGTKEDIAYAKTLWKALKKERITGANMKPVVPFVGAAKPHGWILELVYQNIEVNDHRGFVVVKRNYDNERLTVEDVMKDRASNLSSFTVMFQREAGYDEDNQNWFWVKFKPNGEMYSKKIQGKKVKIAGRFLKGKNPEDNVGCIYCHASAGGGDYIFYPFIENKQTD